MFSRIAACLIPVLVGGLAIATDAHAETNGAGLTFRAYFPSDESCFSATSYGAIVNTCTTARWMSASLPVPSGWHDTNVSIFGDNSMCQTVSTNGVGNGADVGAQTWTTAGPQTWQLLDLGSRFVWDTTPVVFRCLLEPSGIVGSFAAL